MISVVVLDRRTDKNASTGLFELAYRQPAVPVPSYVGVHLIVEGQVIKKPVSENGAGRKTSNDGGLHNSRDGNSSQNKVRCVNNSVEEPGTSTHRIKPIDAGIISTHRVYNRTSQTKTTNSTNANSVSDSKVRQKLVNALATDSVLNAKMEGVGAADGVKDRRIDQQKCKAGVVRRQRVTLNRDPCNSESSESESESEPPKLWSKSKTTKTATAIVKMSASSTFKTSNMGRRRSNVPAGESAASSQPPLTATTSSGGKRRKATRPGAARPRRHRRSKVGGETVQRRQAASDLDSESAPSDHGHGPPTVPSSNVRHPASTSTTTERRNSLGRVQRIPSASKPTRTKPVATTCNMVFTEPAMTSRQSRHRRRTPSFHDLTRCECQLTSASPSVAVYTNGLSHADVFSPCAQSYSGPSRLTTDAWKPRTLLPITSLFPARHIGASRRIILPVDCWLPYSNDTAAAALHFTSPTSRSMVMRGRDFTDLQASMQVIGLGNTA